MSQDTRRAVQSAEDIEAQIAYERIRYIFQLAALPQVGAVIFSVVVAYAMWGRVPAHWVVAWVAARIAIGALRSLEVLWFSRDRRRFQRVPYWRARFEWLLVVDNLAWSAIALFFLPVVQSTMLGTLLFSSVLVITALGVFILVASFRSAVFNLLTMLLPLMVAIVWHGFADTWVVLIAIVVYIGLLTEESWRSNQRWTEMTRLRLESVSVAAEREQARLLAVQASLAKTRFLANMSHELRSPLNAVIGAAQLMKAGERDPERQEQLVDAIQRSGTNLLGLIDDILEISRIEAGELKLVEQAFHLFDCVDAAMATAGLAARAKGLQLACVVDPDLPPWRVGDSERLRQVLLNLLGNAIKFTPEGEVVVDLRQGAQASDLKITIRDTGVGIAADALGHVFEPFRQGDDSAKRRFGGSGLGLAIVRQLVQAMGGSVAVHSEPGQGTEFELLLPLPVSAARTDAPHIQERHHVAFFEPHAASAAALHALLLRMGCEVRRCVTTADVRDWHGSLGEDVSNAWLLVCTDSQQAPELLAQAFALLEPYQVIGMSAREGLVLGQDGRLNRGVPVAPTPVQPRTVVKPVSRSSLASRFVKQPLRASGVVTAPVPLEQADGIDDTPTAHILVVEDDALNRVIVTRMLQHAGYRVSAVPDGYSALAALADQVFDLVLMDWQMPDLDGLEVTRRLRAGAAGDAGRAVPIVALTANAFAEDRNACLQAGMNDFLSKPVLAGSLTAAVQRWTRQASLAALAPIPSSVDVPVAPLSQ